MLGMLRPLGLPGPLVCCFGWVGSLIFGGFYFWWRNSQFAHHCLVCCSGYGRIAFYAGYDGGGSGGVLRWAGFLGFRRYGVAIMMDGGVDWARIPGWCLVDCVMPIGSPW